MAENNFVYLQKGKGKFYYAYDNDALVLHCLFQYKLLKGNKCGFPDNAIDKITRLLNNLHISYQVVEATEIKDEKFFEDNQYLNYVDIGNRCLDINTRFDNVIKKLKECKPEKLNEVMELIEKCLE